MNNNNLYRPIRAEILEIRQETASDRTFVLAWNSRPLPGQFFEVSVPRLGEAPVSISAIEDDRIEMTIRKVGRVTGGIFALGPGDALFLRGPYGNGFPLNRFENKHLVIAAGGTGLAPVRPVIRHFAARRGQLAGLDVLLGFKTPDDILFRDDIEKWKCAASIHVTVDKPADAWSGAVGVITTLVPEVNFRDINKTEVIVVGPPLMMKFTVMAFLDCAIPPERIWVSYERRMSCGVGKCGHCKIHDRYVCLDGPVFNYAEARWIQD